MSLASIEVPRLWHGGAPGLRVGDHIEPSHTRQHHPNCPWCTARELQAAGGPRPAMDPLSAHGDSVYLTVNREYARFYASLWGRGDLYRVTPVGDLVRSTEDTVETYRAPAAVVIGVYDRAVRLTMTQRRRLLREWKAADRLHAEATDLAAHPPEESTS